MDLSAVSRKSKETVIVFANSETLEATRPARHSNLPNRCHSSMEWESESFDLNRCCPAHCRFTYRAVFYVIYFKAQQRKEVLDGVPKKIEAMTTPVVKEEERGEMAKEVDHHVKMFNSLVQKEGRVGEHKTGVRASHPTAGDF